MDKTILVADDNPAIVDAVRMILEDEGYRVVSTLDGTSVQAMTDHDPDLILLDIWMSGTDGRVVCQSLKSHPETCHIPVVMFSANRDARPLALEAGADDFLAKPFDIDYLLTLVREYAF